MERPVNAYAAELLYLQIPGSPKGSYVAIWAYMTLTLRLLPPAL